jgi:hypothetical protein
MASVSDIHNFGDLFDYQLRKLEEADIDERDREAIQDFIRYQDTQRGLAASTNLNNCSDLRLSAERADTPLIEMSREDVDALLFDYKHERDMARGTLRNYRKALRKFFDYHDRDWADDIKIGPVPDRGVDTDKTLTENEISALREAANHPRNKALLELLLDTGLRISAVGTLRVGVKNSPLSRPSSLAKCRTKSMYASPRMSGGISSSERSTVLRCSMNRFSRSSSSPSVQTKSARRTPSNLSSLASERASNASLMNSSTRSLRLRKSSHEYSSGTTNS